MPCKFITTSIPVRCLPGTTITDTDLHSTFPRRIFRTRVLSSSPHSIHIHSNRIQPQSVSSRYNSISNRSSGRYGPLKQTHSSSLASILYCFPVRQDRSRMGLLFAALNVDRMPGSCLLPHLSTMASFQNTKVTKVVIKVSSIPVIQC